MFSILKEVVIYSVAFFGLYKFANKLIDDTKKREMISYTHTLINDYPNAGECLRKIAFYKKEEGDTYGEVFVSGKKEGREYERVIDRCRQDLISYYNRFVFLHKNGYLDTDYMKESGFYARAVNFRKLVEPLDHANFKLVEPAQNYGDGNNRPAIYKYIEALENDPANKNFI